MCRSVVTAAALHPFFGCGALRGVVGHAGRNVGRVFERPEPVVTRGEVLAW